MIIFRTGLEPDHRVALNPLEISEIKPKGGFSEIIMGYWMP